MNRTKRVLYFITLLTLTISLTSGCQLAVSPSDSGSGRLCGALVSWQDVESPDDMGKILDGTITGAEGGEGGNSGSGGTLRVSFPGMEGYEFILRTVTESDPDPITGEEVSVTDYIGSPDFTDIQYAVRTDDHEEENAVSARLMVPADFDRIFYLYPVYEREDGTYYLLLEPARVSSSGGLGSATLSQSFSETLSLSESGKESRSIVSISISITGTEGVETLYLKAFSADDRLLSTEEISPGSHPDYPISRDTAYVIAEEHLADGRIRRVALNRPEQETEYGGYTCYFADGPDSLLPVEIQLAP